MPHGEREYVGVPLLTFAAAGGCLRNSKHRMSAATHLALRHTNVCGNRIGGFKDVRNKPQKQHDCGRQSAEGPTGCPCLAPALEFTSMK